MCKKIVVNLTSRKYVGNLTPKNVGNLTLLSLRYARIGDRLDFFPSIEVYQLEKRKLCNIYHPRSFGAESLIKM